MRRLLFSLILLLGACDVLVTELTVVEIKCRSGGLDADKRCTMADRVGAVVELRINSLAQKVQMTVIKNDGNWWVKDVFFDTCTIVDASNWRCTQKSIPTDNEYGMVRGRYYYDIGPSSTSSVGGLSGWLLRHNYISMKTALNWPST